MCIRDRCRIITEEGGILDKSEEMDEKIAKVPGVEFLISCLTGLRSNRKRAAARDDAMKLANNQPTERA